MDESCNPAGSPFPTLLASRAEQETGRVFHYRPHAHTEGVLAGEVTPVEVADQYPGGTKMARVNSRVGVKITNAVGTMACAYVFTVIALISLPSALKTGSFIIIISWIAQTLLQFVLLSIITVGQNVQAQAVDQRAQTTYKDVEAVLHESLQIPRHLESQDHQIAELLAKIESLENNLASPSSDAGSPSRYICRCDIRVGNHRKRECSGNATDRIA